MLTTIHSVVLVGCVLAAIGVAIALYIFGTNTIYSIRSKRASSILVHTIIVNLMERLKKKCMNTESILDFIETHIVLPSNMNVTLYDTEENCWLDLRMPIMALHQGKRPGPVASTEEKYTTVSCPIKKMIDVCTRGGGGFSYEKMEKEGTKRNAYAYGGWVDLYGTKFALGVETTW